MVKNQSLNKYSKSRSLFFVWLISGVFIVCLMSFFNSVRAETTVEKSDSVMIAPESWRKERLEFPLSFAPSLDYQGFEDVRFAPGWGQVQAEDFWTYAFVWYLDVDPQLTTDRLSADLQAYFDGLMQLIADGKKIEAERVIKTTAKIRQLSVNGGYEGKVKFFDAFFTENAVTLNIQIKQSYCQATQKYRVFFALSPQESTHEIWHNMDNIKVLCDESEG